MMKYKLWILSIVLAFCGFNVYSQTAEQVKGSENTYVISKQDLVTAIAQLLNNDKASQLDEQSLLFQERELRRLFITKQLMQKRMSSAYPVVQQAYAPATASTHTDNSMLEHRLASIENQLSYIANLVNRQVVVDTIRRSHAYVYNSGGQAQQTGEALSQAIAQQNNYDAESALIDSLSALLAQQSAVDTKHTTMEADSSVLKMLEMLVAQNKALKNELANMQQPTHAPAPTPVIIQAHTPQYTGEVDKVFFENNSSRLNADAKHTIQKLVEQLNSRGNLQVMVKGFASKVGASVYNQELSLKRTDAVKEAIVSAGIDPGRVLSAYYGEDLSNDDEAYARRVEILYINSFVNK